jgi:tetratricopeptide (TPR) repeat protein
MNDYNSVVKKSSRLRVLLILLVLTVLILGPRPLTGAMDLASANNLEAAGNNAGAASAYASAAERLPWMPSLWELAGEASFLDHNSGNSIHFLNMAVRRGAISRLGWLDLGNAYQQHGDTSSALNAWEQALPLVEAYGNLAQAQQKAGNFSAAIENWQANIDQEPDNANAHYQLGLLYAASNPSQALPELMLAARLNPDLEKTTQSLRTALNTALLSDNNAYQFVVSGRALAALGRWDLATEAFRNAVHTNEEYAEAWAWLGLAKQQQGQDGTYELSRAITLNPGTAIIQGLYGMYLQHDGKSNEALVAFQKAANLEPDNPVWQMALGNTFEQTGDLISAYSYYLHAVELAPEDPSTWRALATFSVNNLVDVDATGISAARKLVELSPDDWYSYDLAGQAALLLYDYYAAEDYLNKAVQLAPTEAAPMVHLGLAYIQSGALSSAYSYLILAKTLDPAGPYGWQAGRLLEQFFP